MALFFADIKRDSFFLLWFPLFSQDQVILVRNFFSLSLDVSIELFSSFFFLFYYFILCEFFSLIFVDLLSVE